VLELPRRLLLAKRQLLLLEPLLLHALLVRLPAALPVPLDLLRLPVLPRLLNRPPRLPQQALLLLVVPLLLPLLPAKHPDNPPVLKLFNFLINFN
jgi:hypothetical protein